MQEYIQSFKALSDETRIRIIRLLIEADYELCICQIVECLQLPVYTISRHTKELRYSGLIKERKEGRFILISLFETPNSHINKIYELIRSIPDIYFKKDIDILKQNITSMV